MGHHPRQLFIVGKFVSQNGSCIEHATDIVRIYGNPRMFYVLFEKCQRGDHDVHLRGLKENFQVFNSRLTTIEVFRWISLNDFTVETESTTKSRQYINFARQTFGSSRFFPNCKLIWWSLKHFDWWLPRNVGKTMFFGHIFFLNLRKPP